MEHYNSPWFLVVDNFSVFYDHEALEKIGKKVDYTLAHRKGTQNGNADYTSRLPQPAIGQDRIIGCSSWNPPDDEDIYMVHTCELITSGLATADIGLGGPIPQAPDAKLGGLPFTDDKFLNVHRHRPRNEG